MKKRIFWHIIYEIGFLVLFFAYLPFILRDYFVKKKYQHSFKQRLGIDLPDLDKLSSKDCFWFHAVSLGETKAIVPLVKSLKEKYPLSGFIFSSITETGYAQAHQDLPFLDAHLYLPLDFLVYARIIAKKVRPKAVFISETDLWFNFLSQFKAFGAKIFIVNGKLSERSFSRFQSLEPISSQLLELIDLYCLQGEVYRSRFEALGVPNEKMFITGNTKVDSLTHEPIESQIMALKSKLQLKQDQAVLVFGSTHDPEESLAIEVTQNLWKDFPDLKVLIVPRHPERFDHVASLLEKASVNFERFSKLSKVNQSSTPCVLVDAMGVLNDCYALAYAAVVCGTFTQKVGGHNLFEPLIFGVPCLFGPYTHTQQEAKDLIINYQAGTQCQDAKDLSQALRSLLLNPELKIKQGQKAQDLIKLSKGATDKTLSALENYFKEKK